MRNTLFGLLSVVVLAAALTVGPISVTPVAEAQFASNNRSVNLRETAAGNVATPASGYRRFFVDSTYKSLMTKDSGGLVAAAEGRVSVPTTLAVTTVLTEADAGEVILYNGAASASLTLPTITASNIGMRFYIVAVDTDDLNVVCEASDTFTDATDGTVDANVTIIATSPFATAEFIAISATQWLVIPTGTWTIE